MEDFQSAFGERNQDTTVLHDSDRKIAAMHLGGVTVECLLKALILSTVPKSQRMWKNDDCDPGHTFTNPGHSFEDALKRNNALRHRVSQNSTVKNWIKIVQSPNGEHFIDMRYSSNVPHDKDYKEWWFAYSSLLKWLLAQPRK
jgi:hypothetical protein